MGVNDSMKSSFEKKSLAFAIIVLFFGISIIPSMGAERPVLIETIYVDDDGGADYTSIHEIIDNKGNNKIKIFIFVVFVIVTIVFVTEIFGFLKLSFGAINIKKQKLNKSIKPVNNIRR